MGILRKAALVGLGSVGVGVASVGGGMAYLAGSTTFVPLTKDDPMFKTKTWRRYNPRENPAFKDDIIKTVPLSKIRQELRNDETALTLEFCRGVWSRWGTSVSRLGPPLNAIFRCGRSGSYSCSFSLILRRFFQSDSSWLADAF